MEKLTAVPHAMRVNDPREAARLVQDALAAGDVDGLVSIYADDAVVVPSPGEVATGSTAVRGMLEGWLAEGRLTLKHKTLHQSGEIALEVMEWTMTPIQPDGTPSSGIAATVLRRQPDGTWRMQIDNCFVLD
jgi:uncharacterized protein (TIGR02246 family)